jgi:hypothetical protein
MTITQDDIISICGIAGHKALKVWDEFKADDDVTEILVKIQTGMNRLMIRKVPLEGVNERASDVLALHIIACLVAIERVKRELMKA